MEISNTDILYLSTLIPRQLVEEVKTKSRSNMQDAANALQWHIYDGIKDNLGYYPNCINVMPLGSFPEYYKDPFIKRQILDSGDSVIHNVGFCNVKLIRRFLMSNAIYRELKQYYRKATSPNKLLIVYTLNEAFLHAISKIKKRYPDIEVCAVVADLPDMLSLSTKASWLHDRFSDYLAKKTYKRLGCIDKYVLLTEQMAEYLNIEKGKYCVMEGISTAMDSNIETISFDDDIKRVLYSGTLHKRFGVLNLVEAFMMIDNPDIRLLICGVGDSEEEIKLAARKDSRIEFLGQLPREKVLSLQKSVNVLVNPRQNNEEFTKYSFPSKNLEYLSSGTPLIAYKLDGIPEDYTPYMNYVPDDTLDSLAQVIREVSCDSDGRYRLRAMKAQRFVAEEKNSKKQTEKIIRFINQTRV